MQIVLDEYHALIPTLRAADSVPALQGEINHLKSALAAQVAATEREAQAAAAAKARADEVRRNMQAAKATAESRALRAEAALEQLKESLICNATERLAVAEIKIADQAKQIKALLTIRRQRSKGAECEKAGCTDGQYARGLCIRHYQQERRAQASGICPSCGLIRAVGRSGRCRACYLSAVTTMGRDAARCCHV